MTKPTIEAARNMYTNENDNKTLFSAIFFVTFVVISSSESAHALYKNAHIQHGAQYTYNCVYLNTIKIAVDSVDFFSADSLRTIHSVQYVCVPPGVLIAIAYKQQWQHVVSEQYIFRFVVDTNHLWCHTKKRNWTFIFSCASLDHRAQLISNQVKFGWFLFFFRFCQLVFSFLLNFFSIRWILVSFDQMSKILMMSFFWANNFWLELFCVCETTIELNQISANENSEISFFAL